MNYRIAKSPIVIFAAAAAIASTAFAQDRDVQHQPDQSASSHRSDQNSEQRDEHDQRGSAPEQRSPQRENSRNSDERDADHSHRMPSADDNDLAARYRQEHPRAAARCHDGFFTRTSDRHLACSKHGGIDIWLLQ